MTPKAIIIMFHYFGGYNHHDYPYDPALDRESENCMRKLLVNEMLEKSIDCEGKVTYQITNRGKTYVEFILDVPLPAEKWEVQLKDRDI